jgi:Kef-type K+ transport system membrane component KefB/mannitol/fructose-specific phosphotransferase system IIA component (Ntr-type)
VQFINERNILIFLIQLVILLFSAKAAGEFFRRLKQPALVGEILVGIIFGPTVLGRLLPGVESFLFPADSTQKNMFETVSWLGVFFLLLVTGFEVDARVIWRERKTSLNVGLVGMFLPMIVGTVMAIFLPERFMGQAGSKVGFVVAKVLEDSEILKSDFGLTILASSALKDILAWVGFTFVIALAIQKGLAWLSLIKVIGGTALFLILSFTIGRNLVNRTVRWMNRSPLPKPGIVLSFVALLGAACGAISHAIGIHATFGFLIAGIMAGEASEISERSRETISQFVGAIFVPLFFVSVGLKVDFLKNFDLLIVSLICAIDVGGKFLGAYVGAKLARIPNRDSLAMGVALIPGGAMEIIIAGLALEYGLITVFVFEAVIIAALLSSVVVGPLLSLTLGLYKAFNATRYLLANSVIPELSGNTPQEAIGELCNSVSLNDGMPGSTESCAAVNIREKIFGTGMEKGIAIPHAKLDSISTPVFTFGRSSKGIEWNTADGLPVNLVFLLLTPKEDKEDFQVKILAAIARTMENEKARHEMLSAKTAEEMGRVFSAALRYDRMRTLRLK